MEDEPDGEDTMSAIAPIATSGLGCAIASLLPKRQQRLGPDDDSVPIYYS
jgi:hypothetical protein